MTGDAPRAPEQPGDILDSSDAGGRFLRGGALRVLAYGGGVLASVGSTPFVYHYLGNDRFGEYLTVTSLIVILAAITEGGLGNVGVREFSNADEAARRRLIGDLLGLRLALTLAGALAGVLFALVAGYNHVLVIGTVLGVLGLFVTNTQYTLAVPLLASLRLQWLAVTDFVGQFLAAVVMITFVLAHVPLLPFFAVAGVAAVAMLAINVLLVRGEVSMRPSFVLARWRPLISESLIYAAATALGVVYFRVVVVGVSLLAPTNEAGYFDTAFRILDIVNSVPSLLLVSAFPIMARAARDDPLRLRYILQRLFDGSLILGGWLSLCVVMGAPFAIAVLRAHHQSIGVLRIIGAGVPATFLVYVGSFILLSLRRYRTLMAINAVIFIVAIGVCAVLISADHAHGAAFVTLSLELLLSGSYFAVIVVERPDLRPSLAQLPRIAAAIALAFTAALPLSDHAVLAVIAGSAALLVALLILRAMPDEIIVALRRRRGAEQVDG